MMGASGSFRYTGPTSETIRRQVEEARQKEKERLITEVNELLKRRLSRYNDRDPEMVKAKLNQIASRIKNVADLETILFGGSVAKQTAVQGLSDVDALVVLKDESLAAQEPHVVLDNFFDVLRKRLPRS